MIIVFALGATNVFDFVVGDGVPDVRCLGICDERCLARYNSARHQCHSFRADSAWEDLQPSLGILRKVCPQAASWVLDRHETGMLSWVDDPFVYGLYLPASGRLVLSSRIFSVNDGTRASILAHEYRHSRQSYSKHLRRLLCAAFFGGDQEWIVEDDARKFEMEVYLAVFD